jgi:hypothetical protein
MESRQHWMHAWNAVGKEQAQREAWDPAAATAEASQSWDQTEAARRPKLRLAHLSARHALALARTEPESYRSVRWLARVECALEQHREELRLAQRLASIAPGDEGALTCLLQAAKCNGRKELERQTLAALKRRHTSPAAGVGPPTRANHFGKADAADGDAPLSGPAARRRQKQ